VLLLLLVTLTTATTAFHCSSTSNCVLLLYPRPVIPPPLSLSLPPRHALTGYACAPPANILRGW